jgi:hypothetical protein
MLSIGKIKALLFNCWSYRIYSYKNIASDYPRGKSQPKSLAIIFRFTVFIVSLFAMLCSTSSAQVAGSEQATTNFDRKQIDIPRTTLRPVIDGVLDDEIWQQAAVITDLHQMLPVDHGAPSQESVFYVAYSEDYFYLAARLYDTNPEEIRAMALIHDDQSMGNDDQIYVILDTFDNNLTGFRFVGHPNGLRADAVFENPGTINWNWDGIWDTNSRIDEEGWTTELAIPFITLNFDPEADEWGFSLGREIARENESIAWSSFNRNNNPSTAGQASGISDVNQGIGLDIVPSVTVAQKENHVIGDSSDRFDPSLDVFYKFTPNLTGALTINTDFSATDVDNRQVNLTRFSLFFPERRDFFLQDSEIFTFGGLSGGNGARANSNGIPFYSRRIGLDPSTGSPVDMEVGGKLTGRVGNISVGALMVQQGDRVGLDGQDVFVGRATANVLSESRVGVIMTEGDPNSVTDSTLVGTDFIYRNTRFSDTHSLTGNYWYQQSDTDGVVGDQKAYSASTTLSTQGTGFSGSLRYTYLGDEFDPAMGFANRTGIEQVSGFISARYFFRNHPLIRNTFNFVRFSHSRSNDTDDMQSEAIFARLLSINTHNGDELSITARREREGLQNPFEIRPGVIIPQGKYAFESIQFELNTTNQRNFSPDISYRIGDFYNGERSESTLGINWTASRNIQMALNYEYTDVDMPEGDFVTRLISMNLDFAFSPEWSWRNLMQYDNGSDTVGLNSRLRWNPRAGEDLFLVLNYNTDSFDGAFRGLQVRESEVVLKYTRNFRF